MTTNDEPSEWGRKHIAILGMGPSVNAFTEKVKRAGGSSGFCDEVWGINCLGNVFDCHRIFHMDDVRIQEIRATARPESNIAQMLKWMRGHPGPIYTSRAHPDYPGLVEYPLEDVLNETGGFAYMNSTAAYAVALAVAMRVRKITCFGMDFTYPSAHDAEKGRACVEFWLGMGAARGIQISVANVSSLMDACAPARDRLYGFDTITPRLERTADKITVTFEPVAELPTAEQIEARYDHTAHPNPIVAETLP